MPGVQEFLTLLHAREIHRAVFTRNGRDVALATLRRLALDFDMVMAREDGPVKPDPTIIWRICERWQLEPSQVALIGDYRFDIEAAHNAGVRAVLYAAEEEPSPACGASEADFCLHSFTDTADLLAWFAKPL